MQKRHWIVLLTLPFMIAGCNVERHGHGKPHKPVASKPMPQTALSATGVATKYCRFIARGVSRHVIEQCKTVATRQLPSRITPQFSNIKMRGCDASSPAESDIYVLTMAVDWQNAANQSGRSYVVCQAQGENATVRIGAEPDIKAYVLH